MCTRRRGGCRFLVTREERPMGSVQPFLEGSFRNDRARGFSSIQSEAVIRVGRILKSREEVDSDLLSTIVDRPRQEFVVIFRWNAPQVYCDEMIFRGRGRVCTARCWCAKRVFQIPRWRAFSRSFRSATELRNGVAFAKRSCGKDTYRNIEIPFEHPVDVSGLPVRGE